MIWLKRLSLSIQEARRALFVVFFHHGTATTTTIPLSRSLNWALYMGINFFFWLFGKFVFFSTAAGACPPANPYITIYISSFLVSLCFLALHFFFYYSYTTCEKYKCSGGGDDGRGKNYSVISLYTYVWVEMWEMENSESFIL